MSRGAGYLGWVAEVEDFVVGEDAGELVGAEVGAVGGPNVDVHDGVLVAGAAGAVVGDYVEDFAGDEEGGEGVGGVGGG